MHTTVAPPRRRWVWLVVLLLIVVVIGLSASLRFLIAGFEMDGMRIALVFPTGVHATGGSVPPITVSPVLAAAGVRAKGEAMEYEGSNILFIQSEHAKVLVSVSAADAPLDTERLGYALFATDGELIRTGPVRPPMRIEPGKTAVVEIVDVRVTEAARVEIRKLP